MKFSDTLNKILDKYAVLAKELEKGHDILNYIEVSKEHSKLEETVILITKYQNKIREMEHLKFICENPCEDRELVSMAEDEYLNIKDLVPSIEKEIKLSLLPKDINDDKNAILEIRAGTGGEEAALFAGVLLNMYQRYAEKRKWKFEILSLSETGIGGIKEVINLVSGRGVFARMKFESGVHRVQRIPKTEVNGRIHTSAATIAVLPEIEEVEVNIDEKDLQIDTYRASGAGGQHVNTTDSAVRITHLPTGIVVTQQDERSQHKNKARAMKILLAKIYDLETSKRHTELSSQRKAQVGSGDRSERIRTYNFPQGRVTDHRINFTVYNISNIVDEGNLDEIVERLIHHDETEKLSIFKD